MPHKLNCVFSIKQFLCKGLEACFNKKINADKLNCPNTHELTLFPFFFNFIQCDLKECLPQNLF